MVTQVPLFSSTLPDPYNQTSEEFELSVVDFNKNLNPYGAALNEIAIEVQELAAKAEAAAGALANAVWVSGTTYAIGDVRYSPVDFLVYRRKTVGAGTTDPSLDATNWALQTKTGAGGSDTTSSAVDITLTSTSGRLQVISMTAPAKKVTLPAAGTLNKGSSIFVIKNSGTYRFAAHKNGGAFLCFVQPGQVVALHCSDISTGAGIWHVGGDAIEQINDSNNAETLNGVDSRLISVAMLSSTKAICAFRNNSTTFLNAVVLNFGSASGAPSAINAEASEFISIAAQSSSQATVVYKTLTGVTKGYVLDISGNTITPGTVATIDSATASEGTGIAALSSTKLLCVYGASGGAKERVLDISASAITASAAATASATLMAGDPLYLVRKITTTKALVAGFVSATNASILLALQSISGSTPAQTGSSLTVSAPGSIVKRQFGLVVMSASRVLLAQPIDQLYRNIMLSIVDISGTSPVLVSSKIVRVGLIVAAHVSAAKLSANSAYITWTGGASGGIDSMVVTLTNDDRIIVGQLTERIDPSVTSAAGYLDCDALDSTHVMQVHRNSLSYLSAKTIEISL
jgi:hypothetical protein